MIHIRKCQVNIWDVHKLFFNLNEYRKRGFSVRDSMYQKLYFYGWFLITGEKGKDKNKHALFYQGYLTIQKD